MTGTWTQRLSFRLHQWIGLACAVVFLIVGCTGAILAFEEQIVEAWPTPPVTVAGQPLSPAQLVPLLALADARLERIYAPAAADMPGRALYRRQTDQQRFWRAFDPYTGHILGPQPTVYSFIGTVRALHRWLLLPHSFGSLITGSAALAGIILILAGLIRRAPDRWYRLRDWLAWKKGRKGRHRLWQWHALLGTWFCIPLLIMAISGPWFAYQWYRQGVSQLLTGAPQQHQPLHARRLANASPDLNAIWQQFLTLHPSGDYARWYQPQRPGTPIRIRYLDDDAPYHHAFSEVKFANNGQLLQQRRYSDLHGGEHIVASMYGLHTGLYFGLLGQWIWALAALAFASFSVTGIWLFCKRRARPRETRSGADTLIAYASQTGTAAQQAQRLQQWLASQQRPADLCSLAHLAPETLSQYQYVLVLAATYGEGEAPDNTLSFQQQLRQSHSTLCSLEFSVLAFGDRQYQHFCAFGHWLAGRLTELGAKLTMPVVEVDRGSEQGVKHYYDALATRFNLTGQWTAQPQLTATLQKRQALNSEPQRLVYDIELALTGAYQAGDLLEFFPYWDQATSSEHLQRLGYEPTQSVRCAEQTMPLWQAIAEHREWRPLSGRTAQQLVDELPPLAPRSYSLANVPQPPTAEGLVRLMVRLDSGDYGVGRSSGLLSQMPLDSSLAVRFRAHPSFHMPTEDVPLLLIGTGTGLAPYLSFLQQHSQQHRQAPVWLLFGERYEHQDAYYYDELMHYQQQGVLTHVDFAWSRSRGDYVQDKLRAQQPRLQHFLAQGAHIYVCGGIHTVGTGIQQALEALLPADQLNELVRADRYHRDLY